jgi:hypothetical protein
MKYDNPTSFADLLSNRRVRLVVCNADGDETISEGWASVNEELVSLVLA